MKGSSQSDMASVIPIPVGMFSTSAAPNNKYPDVHIKAPYVVCAYLVRHPKATILFDTGIVGDEEAVRHYRPRFSISMTNSAPWEFPATISMSSSIAISTPTTPAEITSFPGFPLSCSDQKSTLPPLVTTRSEKHVSTSRAQT